VLKYWLKLLNKYYTHADMVKYVGESPAYISRYCNGTTTENQPWSVATKCIGKMVCFTNTLCAFRMHNLQ